MSSCCWAPHRSGDPLHDPAPSLPVLPRSTPPGRQEILQPSVSGTELPCWCLGKPQLDRGDIQHGANLPPLLLPLSHFATPAQGTQAPSTTHERRARLVAGG